MNVSLFISWISSQIQAKRYDDLMSACPPPYFLPIFSKILPLCNRKTID